MRFQTNDTWSLNNFQADCGGVKLAANGAIAHAPELRQWEIFHAPKTGGPPQWPAQLKKISDTLDRIHFTNAPLLTLTVNGDARDVKTFRLRLDAQIPGATTPWGDVQKAVLNVNARPQDLNSLPPLARAARGGAGRNAVGAFATRHARHPDRRRAAQQPPPAVVHLEAAAADTRWGGAHDIRFDATLAAAAPANVDAAWGWWTNLQPYQFNWTARMKELKSEKLNADSVAARRILAARRNWPSPICPPNSAAARSMPALRLNVATRELSFTNSSDFDLHAVAALLDGKNARAAR